MHAWLYRTPIHGSSPGDENDDACITKFIHDYVEAARVHAMKQAQMFQERGVMTQAASEKRMTDAVTDASSFLMADDVDEAERSHRRRVRAALLFIESYRDLPLLAWPRRLIDAVVEMGHDFSAVGSLLELKALLVGEREE